MPENEGIQLFYTAGETARAPHWHGQLEILYVVEGVLHLGIEKEIIRLEEEEIYLIDSGVTHYFLESGYRELIRLKVSPQLYDFLTVPKTPQLVATLIAKKEKHSRNWPAQTTAKIQELLAAIYETFEEEKSYQEIEILGLFSQLLVTLGREVPETVNDYQKISPLTLNNQAILGRLEQVYRYVDTYYQEDITVKTAAAILGVSPNYFSRFFKKNVGLTFHRFLNEYRINKAKYILSRELIPMTEVAERSGFSSSKTFHHVFKEIEGISPLKYQRIVIGKK